VVSFGRYDCSADIWSLGITLLEFALGQAPLQNCNLDQILMRTLNEPPPILESSDRRKRFTEVRKEEAVDTKSQARLHLPHRYTKDSSNTGKPHDAFQASATWCNMCWASFQSFHLHVPLRIVSMCSSAQQNGIISSQHMALATLAACCTAVDRPQGNDQAA
jgi:serine/threonine protein kinase